jgi:polyisoprenoid-binding protein YceI
MKKAIYLPFAMMGIFFLASCGGGGEASSDETAAPESDETMTEEVAEATYTIDPASSTVSWDGTMLGIKTHTGNINITEGTLTVKGGEIIGGSFTVDMGSITPTDENYDEDSTQEKLVGHLSSPDFFDVENHPTATFTVTGAADGAVNGDLNVRGKSNPESVTGVRVEETEGGVTATGSMTFNRMNYDVAFDMGMADMVISDDINLNVNLVGNK